MILLAGVPIVLVPISDKAMTIRLVGILQRGESMIESKDIRFQSLNTTTYYSFSYSSLNMPTPSLAALPAGTLELLLVCSVSFLLPPPFLSQYPPRPLQFPAM